MRRIAIVIPFAMSACSPHFENGKTECSDLKQCPSGYSCKDDPMAVKHYCFDNKTLGCPDGSGFYCPPSGALPGTCFATPGACATVTFCGTPQYPGYAICGSLGYRPSCSGTTCIATAIVPDAGPAGGAIGTGGTTAKTGAGGITTIGYGGSFGTGGAGGSKTTGLGGNLGSGGVRDAGLDGRGGVVGTGGAKLDAAVDGARDGIGGIVAAGGFYVSGGASGRGGVSGSGGYFLTGGSSGRGGVPGTGGSTVSAGLCSGTPDSCAVRDTQGYCQIGNGCTWSSTSSTCSGTPYACSTLASGTQCLLDGCTWSGSYVCNATPTTAACTATLNSSSTVCDSCIVNYCCGQITDCTKDPNCAAGSGGQVWNNYLDCVVGCCGSASRCGLY